MAGRDIQIPFGPDKTGGWGIEPIAPEGEEAVGDSAPAPLSETLPRTMPAPLSETLPDLAHRIYEELKDRHGNYMVFLPSFEYLDMLSSAVEKMLKVRSDLKIIKQKPSMTEIEKNDYLYSFDAPFNGLLVGFAVLGGHFGEGIDLTGEKLSGVIIVGVGLPKITPERQILSNYYMEKFGDGFAFAYRFPGWEKVLQAVGRVIRTEEDTGFALLIDERLDNPEYMSLYPDNWKI